MRVSLVASSAALLLVACASSKPAGTPPVEVQSTGVPGQAAAVSTHRMTATVLAVDTASRKLTLRGEDGQTETVTVPPEVRRFNEVAVGDTIQAEVQEGLLFEYQPAGSAFVAPRALVAGARTDANQAPGAGVATAVQSTVTITAIHLDSRIVQFQDPDGNKYEVKAGPKLSIEKLAVGDRLLATYATTVIIALDKKP
jgi:hypothetical protein